MGITILLGLGRLRPSLALISIFCCLGVSAWAEEETRHSFDIPAGMAIDSLKLVARQGGVEIVFDSRVTTEVRTPAIRGSFTPLQAFQLLLKDTSLVVFQDVETAAFAVYRKRGTEPNTSDRVESSVLKPKPTHNHKNMRIPCPLFSVQFRMNNRDFLILCFLIASSWSAMAKEIQIEVHPGKVLRTYSRSPIGINLNYIRDHDDNRPDEAIPLAEALQTMGCHWLRYPGGEKSDWHFFKPTPYHVDSVIKSQPTGWYAIPAHEHELLDFDDFMEVVRAYEAEPYVVVPSEPEHRSGVDANTYIEHAAAWVHYANRKKDYGVTYWEIGNENWNRDSHESVADYVTRAVHIAKAMKAVDPDIRIGCSASSFGQFKAVLRHGEGFFDFLSLSNYVGSASTGWHGGDWIGGFGHYRSLWPGALTKLPVQAVAAIRDVAPGAGMEIIISEFNAVDFEGIWPNRNDLGHALVAFDMLGESLRVPHLSAVILWTTRWMEDQRHNDEMWYALDAENRPTAAIGYAMSIWGRYFKPAVVAVETPVASLSAHAVADPNSGALTVFIINKSNDTAEIPLRIAGTTNYDKAKLYCFDGQNAEDTDPRLRNLGLRELADNTIALRLPPISLTTVDFPGPLPGSLAK